MASQDLRDRNGRLIGKIEIKSDGRQELRDSNGRFKGVYDPKKNQTKDTNGRLIGTGNLLATLL